MKALDTNVLLRYLVKDEPRQAVVAKQFIQSCTEEQLGFINIVVLCELIWVLRSRYGYEKSLIADIIGKILETEQLLVESAESVEIALGLFRKHNIGFSDAFIAAFNRQAGYQKTATFDKKAAKLDEFELLS